MNRLRRLIETELFGTLSLVLAVTLAFGLVFFAGTSARAQGETAGTLPVVKVFKTCSEVAPGSTWTIEQDGIQLVITSSVAQANPSTGGGGTDHVMTWRCKYTTHALTVHRETGETNDSYEARCAGELSAAQRHFPADNT